MERLLPAQQHEPSKPCASLLSPFHLDSCGRVPWCTIARERVPLHHDMTGEANRLLGPCVERPTVTMTPRRT
jgi:hypothetical protein